LTESCREGEGGEKGVMACPIGRSGVFCFSFLSPDSRSTLVEGEGKKKEEEKENGENLLLEVFWGLR
jgi:hypothetical protein